jgi:hypothetical protein
MSLSQGENPALGARLRDFERGDEMAWERGVSAPLYRSIVQCVLHVSRCRAAVETFGKG